MEREKHVLELTLTAGDDDDSDRPEMEVVGVVKPDLRLMFSFNLLIINSTLFIYKTKIFFILISPIGVCRICHLLVEVCRVCVIILIGIVTITTLLGELKLLNVLLLLVNNVELFAEISSEVLESTLKRTTPTFSVDWSHSPRWRAPAPT